MNTACSPAQVAGKLVIQIQSLLHAPGTPLKTPDRSPLFQIAAFIEIPELAAPDNRTPVITGQTFALVRDEAVKSHRSRENRPRACRQSTKTI